MSRSGAVTFKGTPMTLAGEAVKTGQPAPDFKLQDFEGGLKTITPVLSPIRLGALVRRQTRWSETPGVPTTPALP